MTKRLKPKTMDNKQTAVDFLWTKASSGEHLTPEDFEQAKAMEKQQIIDANIKGHTESLFGRLCDSEKYYNQTFKSE